MIVTEAVDREVNLLVEEKEAEKRARASTEPTAVPTALEEIDIPDYVSDIDD